MPDVADRHALRLSDGAELAYWRLGPIDDPGAPDPERAIVLLHGAASNHTRWSELVEMTRLKATWCLLWPDLRGNGESTQRTRQGIGVWCDDLLELLDAEGVDRVVVVGHSMGAQIAMHLAHRVPERVRGLVLIDPVVRRALRGKQRSYGRFSGLFRAAATVVEGLNRLGLRRRAIPTRDLRELDRETRKAMAQGEALEVIAERYSALGPILEHMPTANYLRQMAATASELPPLDEIGCPVLVLISAGITFADMDVTRRALGRIPDAGLVTLPANHWPLTEVPDRTREEIEGWVERRFPAASGRGDDG